MHCLCQINGSFKYILSFEWILKVINTDVAINLLLQKYDYFVL